MHIFPSSTFLTNSVTTELRITFWEIRCGCTQDKGMVSELIYEIIRGVEQNFNHWLEASCGYTKESYRSYRNEAIECGKIEKWKIPPDGTVHCKVLCSSISPFHLLT